MKKLIAILMCAALLLSLAACSFDRAHASEAPAEPTAVPEPENSQTAGGKTLVVYFSATNNTEAVANTIAAAMNADVFEIIPSQPYTDDDLNWRDGDSRVSREHDDESLRTVELESTAVDGWADYNTVFVGYPLWWGIAAWPVSSFVAAIVLGAKRFALYIAFVMAFSLITGLIVNLAV